MEAACKGASSEGGATVGILPGENRQAANPYVQIPIVTGMGYARNVAVVKSAQAVIAIGGSVASEASQLNEYGFAALFSCLTEPMSLPEAMCPQTARQMLKTTAEQIMRLWLATNRKQSIQQ